MRKNKIKRNQSIIIRYNMQSACLPSQLISAKHIHSTQHFSPSLSPVCSTRLSIETVKKIYVYNRMNIRNRWKIHSSMSRGRNYSVLWIFNRINYAFYNATEILKIIDVDSEMISGIIFVIYEDIFMSLFLAFGGFNTIFHTHLLRLHHHKKSDEPNCELIILQWCDAH